MKSYIIKSIFSRGWSMFILIVITTLYFTFVSFKSKSHKNDLGGKPNIIVVVVDDLGYGDLGGYFGGKAQTPNLNSLARQGMLFTDFHSNGPMCSPTRASLLTGRYPQRLGIETALSTDWDDEGIGSKKNSNEKTIAAYLKEVGYKTAIFGKWHLGKAPCANPVLHGFDEFRGLTCGSGDYFSKNDRNGFKDWWHNDTLDFQEGYATNVITNNSVQYIESNKDNPFFLYVAYSAIHFPWQTSEDYQLETIQEGEDYTSIYPGNKSKLGPHGPEEVPSVLIKMIEEMDVGIGRILQAIHDEKLENNTLVFVTSDNGGYIHYAGEIWPRVGSNGPLKGQKGQLYEGGHRVPAIAWWPENIQPLSVCDQPIMTFDLLPTFLDILNISLPSPNSNNALDGVSLLPLWENNTPLKSRPLFWRMTNQMAIRDGAWKLVVNNQKNFYELYNLKQDIGEHTDLSLQYPQKVSELKDKLIEWEKDVDVAFDKK